MGSPRPAWRATARWVLPLATVACGPPVTGSEQALRRDSVAMERVVQAQLDSASEILASLRQVEREAGDLLQLVAQVDTHRVVAVDELCGNRAECPPPLFDSLRAGILRLVAEVRASRAANAAAARLQDQADSLRARALGRNRQFDSVRARLDTLRSDSGATADTLKRLRDLLADADSVFVAVAKKAELLKLGAAVERGRTRLLFFGFGGTLVPAPVLSTRGWRGMHRLRDSTITLPEADRWYTVISAHPVSELQAEQGDGNRVKGATLRIKNPGRFWAASRFLVLQEH